MDGTAAGDAFTACLSSRCSRGGRGRGAARACAAGALAASRLGAQPSLPTAAEVDAILGSDARDNRRCTPIVLDCDPGHDDAIALLLALASPEVELLGVTTVAGNQTLEKTTANALRVLELAGRGDIPVARGAAAAARARALTVAAHVHGESGLDGPGLPPPSGAPVGAHGRRLPGRDDRHAPAPVTLVPTGPLTNVALLPRAHGDARTSTRIVLMGGAIAEGNMTPAAEFNIWADPEAAAARLRAGLDVTMVGLDVTHRALMTPDVQRSTARVGRVGDVRRRADRLLRRLPPADVRLGGGRRSTTPSPSRT